MSMIETKTFVCDVPICMERVTYEPALVGSKMDPNNEPDVQRPWLPADWAWIDLTYYGVRRTCVGMACEKCVRKFMELPK